MRKLLPGLMLVIDKKPRIVVSNSTHADLFKQESAHWHERLAR
jgi:hypothetical protein